MRAPAAHAVVLVLRAQFGAAHGAGFVCVMVDGSVKFVAYNVAPTIWHNFCARNDGQPGSL